MVGDLIAHNIVPWFVRVIKPSARMRSEGYSTWSVIPSVCLSVTTFSATTRNKAAKKRYQRVQYYTGLILKMAIFVKVLRSKVMA